MPVSEKKLAYAERMAGYLGEYSNVLLVGVDNVSSHQVQRIRAMLRGRAIVLGGKNTLQRKVIRERLDQFPKLEKLLPHMVGNRALVFTNEDLGEIREAILSEKQPAAARVGVFAPNDCVVPAGPTGLDPGQTGFFQALNISTKIQRGAIEIITPVNLIKKGEKVNASQVSLLAKLNIRPFFFGMSVDVIYENGDVYPADVLDLTDDMLLKKFSYALSYVTRLGLRIGYPTLSTIPHSFARAFQKMLAIAVTTEVSFEQAEKYKLYIQDPEAYAEKYGAVVAAPAEAKGGDAPAAGEAAAAEPEEEEESSDAGLGGGLFGGSDSD